MPENTKAKQSTFSKPHMHYCIVCWDLAINISLPGFYDKILVLNLKRKETMDKTQWIGIIAGVLTATSMLPQVIKVFKEKKAEDISLLMLIVLLSGIALWVVYGVMRNDFPIIATNAFSMLVNLVLVGLRIKYKGR